MSPCKDYCYLRFGKMYSPKCDTECDYAAVVKENKELKERLKKYEPEAEDTTNSVPQEA